MANNPVTPPLNSGYMTPAMVCAMTGLAYITLSKQRQIGTGPKFIKSGNGQVFYDQYEVVKWMAETNRFYPDGSFGPDVLARYVTTMTAPISPNEGDEELDVPATAAE